MCFQTQYFLVMVLGEEEYEVEKILDKRTQKGGYTEYLVKWRNYEVKTRKLKTLFTILHFNRTLRRIPGSLWTTLARLRKPSNSLRKNRN